MFEGEERNERKGWEDDRLGRQSKGEWRIPERQ